MNIIKKIVTVAGLATLVTLAACSPAITEEKVAGRWQYTNADVMIAFSPDGSGEEVSDGERFEFEWALVGANEIEMTFVGDSEGSQIQKVKDTPFHGEYLEVFAIKLNRKNQLVLSDAHDHGHFELIFKMVE